MSLSLFFTCSFFLIIASARLFEQTRSNLPANLFLPGLCIKVLAGWLLGLLYQYYYEGGDTFLYYQDALVLSDLFFNDPLGYIKAVAGVDEVSELTLNNQPRALLFAKLVSLSAIGGLDNYWIMSLHFSVVSFLACWWFVSRLKAYLGLQNYQVCIPFLFFPSVLFWSSGLLKESLAMVFILLLIGIGLDINKHGFSWHLRGILKLITGALSAILLWQLKYYYAAVLLPLIFLIVMMKWVKTKNTRFSSGIRFVFLASLLIIFSWVFMQSHPNLQPQRILHVIMKNQELTVAASQTHGYITFDGIQADVFSFLKHFPKAVFFGLFAPLPWVQGYSVLHLLAGLENTFFLLLSLLAVYHLVMNRNSKVHHKELVLMGLVYIVLLAGLITLASPNFGSLLRYRVAYAPFWLLLVLATFPKNFGLEGSRSRKKIYTNIQGDR